MSNRDFSPRLQDFFTSLGEVDWLGVLPSALFIRDFESLPNTSPHDIDLLVSSGEQQDLIQLLTSIAEQKGLTVTSKVGQGVCFLLVVDVDATVDGRPWAYFEVRDVIRYNKSLELTSKTVQKKFDEALAIPVPSDAWRVFLYILHSYRNNAPEKLASCGAVEHKQTTKAKVRELFLVHLGVDVNFEPQSWEVDKDSHQVLLKSVSVKVKTKKHRRLFKRRLYSYIRRNFYIFPRQENFIFTLHGPDGVGKTTAASEVSRFFDRLPFEIESFHHITSWKHQNSYKEKVKKDAENAKNKASLFHRIARVVFRTLPLRMQNLYILITGYHQYLCNLNLKLCTSDVSGQLKLVDRYVYDMAAKNMLVASGPTWLSKMFCRIMKKPSLSFVLVDSPERILERKQELSANEIARYMSLMRKLVPANSYREISVSERTPEEVSAQIVTQILHHVGPNLTYLLKNDRFTEQNHEH